MKRDKQQSTFVNIGSSSLLMIFLVLCLTIFAVLSLSSAQSDYSFSQKLAEHKTEYYEASSRAELILGEIDDILAETARGAGRIQGRTDPSYTASVSTALNGSKIDGISLSCFETDGETIISYSVPSGQKQALNVQLLVTANTEYDHYYKIQAWRLVSTTEWNADNSLKLMPIEP